MTRCQAFVQSDQGLPALAWWQVSLPRPEPVEEPYKDGSSGFNFCPGILHSCGLGLWPGSADAHRAADTDPFIGAHTDLYTGGAYPDPWTVADTNPHAADARAESYPSAAYADPHTSTHADPYAGATCTKSYYARPTHTNPYTRGYTHTSSDPRTRPNPHTGAADAYPNAHGHTHSHTNPSTNATAHPCADTLSEVCSRAGF